MQPLRSIFILFFILGVRHENAVASALDSLKKLHPKNVNEKVSVFTEIGWEYQNTNLDSAFLWSLKANKLINKHIRGKIAARNFFVLGSLYTTRGQYNASCIWFDKAYRLQKSLKSKEALLETTLSLVYSYEGIGDVKNMQTLALEAEKLCIELNKLNSRKYLTVLCQLSNVSKLLNRIDKAEEYLKKAMAITERGTSDYDKAVILQNYGTLLLRLFKYKKAEPYFERAIVLVKNIGDDTWLYDLNFNLGIVYAETGKRDKAEAIFMDSYNTEMNKPIDRRDSYAISVASKNVSYIAIKKHQYEKALKFLSESIAFAKIAGANDLLADRYMSISEAYEGLKRYPEALKFRKRFEILKDSLFSIETAKQLNELSEKFETEKKEKSILLLSKKNADSKLKQLESKKALTDEKAKSARRNILFASVIFMVILIAGFIYYSLVQKRKAHIKLEEKNSKIELQHELLEEKQKEIIDSINYAKRIQQSLLPSNKYIGKNLNRMNDKNS